MGDTFSSKSDSPPLLMPLNSSKKNTLEATWEYINSRRTEQQSPVGGGGDGAYGIARYRSVQLTVRTLQLDHTRSSTAIISYLVAFFLLILVPVLELWLVRYEEDQESFQLIFHPVVVGVGVSRSVVSFLFLSQSLREYGLQGVLFLDSVAQEVAQVRKDYDLVIEKGSKLFFKIFGPCLLLHVLQAIWVQSDVTLNPLPYLVLPTNVESAAVVVIMTLSWMFQTTTYLYACTLFWKVCNLQGLKMGQYFEMLLRGLEVEYYFLEYERIKRDIKSTSRRFRQFLALTGVIVVSGALISMYEMVDAINVGFPLSMWGEIIVLNVVNVAGTWLCLSSASKISHMHRRTVKRAAAMHARKTMTNPNPPAPKGQVQPHQAILEKLELFSQRQEAWSRRAAIVEFLTRTPVGISIYGFVLDRFVLHTSIGALFTTTWFILGRSLKQ